MAPISIQATMAMPCRSLNKLFLVIGLVWATAASAAPSVLQCPARIQSEQILKMALANWQSEQMAASHPLQAVSFFEGPPADKVELAPASTIKSGKNMISRWIFTKSAATTYLVCRYTGTSVGLKMALSPGVGRCSFAIDRMTHAPAENPLTCK